MFGKLTSSILILALLACPAWCSLGVCPVSGCCASEQEQPAEVAQGCGHSCCQHKARAVPEVPSNVKVPNQAAGSQMPDSCPSDSPCQGICGGAVVEVHCSGSDIFGYVAVLSVCETDAATCERSVGTGSSRTDDILPNSGNQGRLLRTLYESLIC